MKKLICVLITICFALIITACGGENAENAPQEPAVTMDPKTEFSINAEAGSNQMVDALISTARENAKSCDDANAEAALQYLIDNHPEYYTDSTTMEAVIYNGALVEYYYKEVDRNRASIGMDAEQAVKYVYRGAETIEDDATQENLRQVQEGIETL